MPIIQFFVPKWLELPIYLVTCAVEKIMFVAHAIGVHFYYNSYGRITFGPDSKSTVPWFDCIFYFSDAFIRSVVWLFLCPIQFFLRIPLSHYDQDPNVRLFLFFLILFFFVSFVIYQSYYKEEPSDLWLESFFFKMGFSSFANPYIGLCLNNFLLFWQAVIDFFLVFFVSCCFKNTILRIFSFVCFTQLLFFYRNQHNFTCDLFLFLQREFFQKLLLYS